MNFYGVIIGSEILNARREDSHFSFLRDQLKERGFKLAGVFTIEDNPNLMKGIYEFIKSVPNSVMFSFGGIGATPDDYTRKVSAEVFRNGEMEFQKEFEKKIRDRFGNELIERRIQMSYLPKDSGVLKNNPVNGMYGYYLDDRFFFVPGFPEMAHPMITEAFDKFYPNSQKKIFKKNLIAQTSEANLIGWMESLSPEITLSCLPKLDKDESGKIFPSAEIEITSENSEILEIEFKKLQKVLNELGL
ncbi:putative nuleotide-utilizing enzyme, moeA [Thiovulum sp. ES]|nr:putative nuleotide-utilizing enzyme, moeA [Thiovulum sp. ES]